MLDDSQEFRRYIKKLCTSERQKLLLKKINQKKLISGNNLLNRLCAKLTLNYLSENNITALPNEKINKNKLLFQLQVKPPYNHFVDYMLAHLAKDLYITMKNEIIYFDPKITSLESINDITNKIASIGPEYLKASQLLHHCASNYTLLLSGNITHTKVLFPNGNINFANSFLSEFNDKYFNIYVYIDLIKDLLQKLTYASPSISILEIGAGQGILSWEILNFIKKKDILNKFLYHFTDVSRNFIVKAKKYASSNKFDGCMQFSTLDLNVDPLLQGFASNSFDIIVAFDSLHVANNINNSIEFLKNLLKPNGIFVIIESTCLPRWLHFVWGVTPEWWNNSDQKCHVGPLLSVDQWKQILVKSYNSNVYAFPNNAYSSLNHDTAMLICKK